MNNSHSEVKAGIVILVSLAMLTALVLAVGNYQTLLVPKTVVVVRYKNIYGLKVNDPVRYAGVEIGLVKDIKVIHTKDETKTPMVEVSLLIDSRYPIRAGSTAFIDKTITGATSVEITPGAGEIVDFRGREKPEIPAEEVPSFNEMSKRANELLTEAKSILSTLRTDVLGPEQTKSVREIIENVRKASDEVNKAAKTVNEILAENRESLRQTMANVADLTGNVKALVQKNRESIDAIVAKFRTMAERLADFADKLNGLSGDAKKVIADFGNVVSENRDVIRETFISVRDTAANLKLVSDDLRLHPWKLLNAPPTDARSANLADAAKEVSLAAKYVDTSATRLATAVEKPGPHAAEFSAQIKQLVEDLKAAANHLQATQAALEKANSGK